MLVGFVWFLVSGFIVDDRQHTFLEEFQRNLQANSIGPSDCKNIGFPIHFVNDCIALVNGCRTENHGRFRVLLSPHSDAVGFDKC